VVLDAESWLPNIVVGTAKFGWGPDGSCGAVEGVQHNVLASKAQVTMINRASQWPIKEFLTFLSR
jgi:hypothetical protein